MITKSLDELVAEVALSFTDKSSPTSAEILAALYRVGRECYALGVAAGNEHTAQMMNRVLLAMGAP